ncbi:MAG: hypothetical protein IJS60_07645 [Abditibacteriota bacterium]|nr:hypothetical protein [Abditibacteriota bacterium]
MLKKYVEIDKKYLNKYVRIKTKDKDYYGKYYTIITDYDDGDVIVIDDSSPNACFEILISDIICIDIISKEECLKHSNFEK